MNDHGSGGVDADADPDAPFDADEWEALCRAPMIAFLMVAGADGDIGRRESRVFGDLLARYVATPGGDLLARIMRGTITRRDVLSAEAAGGELDPQAIIRATRAALDSRIPAPEAREIKLALLGIGKAVAESSGRRWRRWLLGPRIGREEKVAIARLARHLGLSRE